MTFQSAVASQIPIVDVSSLVSGVGNLDVAATQIQQACRDTGFFYIVGHGVEESLQQRLAELSQEFFPRIWQQRCRFAWRWVVELGVAIFR